MNGQSALANADGSSTKKGCRPSLVQWIFLILLVVALVGFIVTLYVGPPLKDNCNQKASASVDQASFQYGLQRQGDYYFLGTCHLQISFSFDDDMWQQSLKSTCNQCTDLYNGADSIEVCFQGSPASKVYPMEGFPTPTYMPPRRQRAWRTAQIVLLTATGALALILLMTPCMPGCRSCYSLFANRRKINMDNFGGQTGDLEAGSRSSIAHPGDVPKQARNSVTV